METAESVFEESLSWLRQTYWQHCFYVERDVVWTLQKRLTASLARERLPLRVFNDYPIAPGPRRSLSADLCLVDQTGQVALAAELKFEPSHLRKDILAQKLPVVSWGADGVGKDVVRVQQYVERGRASVAYAVFIDEGGASRTRTAHPGAGWVDWGDGIWMLLSKVGPTTPA